MIQSRTTKTRMIYYHLKKHGSITSMEAIEKYGATRLSAIIWELIHREHMDIESIPMECVDRYGNTCKYAKYVYKGENTYINTYIKEDKPIV